MDYFLTKEELTGKIQYYLKNKTEIELMKKNMKEIIQNNTYSNRAKTIIELVTNNI